MASNGDGLPSLKKDLQNSLLLLQQRSASGDSLFEHLSRVISKVIDERPTNVVDYFELFSERVRLEGFEMNENLLEEGYVEPSRLGIAKKLLPGLVEKSKKAMNILADNEDEEGKALEPSTDENNKEDDGDAIYCETPPRDLWELQFYWNLLGIGFPREELFSLACSIERLKANPAIASCRFWGKMLGLKNDYYIVESTLTGSTLEDRILSAVEKPINTVSLKASEEFAPLLIPTESNANTKVENNDDKDNGSDLRAEAESYPTEWNFSMKVAESKYRPPVEIPAEEIGRGVNRHVYFVCSNLADDEWTELPSATPHQINVSRRMKRYLSGNLDEAITSFPAFPGNETNYLRALIARISAGAHVSPRSFYKIGSNEMDEQEDFDDADDDDGSLNSDKPIKANESYRPLSLSKLTKLDYWEHHKPEILKQGRVSFFDGSLLNNNDDDDESDDTSSTASSEEDETEATNNGMNPEIPKALFAPCSGDRLTNDSMSPWTIRLSDVVETLVLLQSHVWPGAFAFAKDRTCDTIYIGFGHKYSSVNYGPLPQKSIKYPLEMIEENDLTVDKEKDAMRQNKNDRNDDVVSGDEDKVDGSQ